MNFHENDLVSLYLSELDEIEFIQTAKQSVCLLKHPILGNVLIINGEIQHVENYQCIYHEMLVHLPMSFLPTPRRVLIIGGGSLFAAYEVLKYSSITKLDLCDYDPEVISLMARHYPHVKTVLSDRRYQYINEDARFFCETTKNKYDIIINDCFNIIKETTSNGLNLSTQLFNLLDDEGICADIIYRHVFDREITTATIKKMKTYSKVCFSLVTVPEYPGILHLEVLWGKNKNLSQNARVSNNFEQNKSLAFQYYSPYMLPFYLYLPPYLNNLFIE